MARAEQVADDDSQLAKLRDRIAASDAAKAESDQRATAAERAAADANNRAAQAVAERVRSDEVAIENAIAAASTALEASKSAVVEAGTANDWAALAEAQDAVAKSRTALDNYTARKAALAQWKEGEVKRINAENARRQQEAERPRDPLEVYSQKTRAWIEGHPELVKDLKVNGSEGRLMAKAVGFHHLANSEGLTTDTPEYFEFIDKRMGFRRDDDDQGDGDAMSEASTTEDSTPSDSKRQERQRQDNSNGGVSPSRPLPGNNGGERRGTVRLTPGQHEAALFSFPHLKPAEAIIEYTKSLVALREEGRM